VNAELKECSAEEASRRKNLLSTPRWPIIASACFAHLFRYGTIEHHGGFVNLTTGRTTPLRIDPVTWRHIQKRRKGNNEAYLACRVSRYFLHPDFGPPGGILVECRPGSADRFRTTSRRRRLHSEATSYRSVWQRFFHTEVMTTPRAFFYLLRNSCQDYLWYSLGVIGVG
jgi:hypothetical protein